MSKSYTITRTVFVGGELIDMSAHEVEFKTRTMANAARAEWLQSDVSKIAESGDYQIMYESHSTITYQTFPGEMGEQIVRCRAEYDVMHTVMALAMITMDTSA